MAKKNVPIEPFSVIEIEELKRFRNNERMSSAVVKFIQYIIVSGYTFEKGKPFNFDSYPAQKLFRSTLSDERIGQMIRAQGTAIQLLHDALATLINLTDSTPEQKQPKNQAR